MSKTKRKPAPQVKCPYCDHVGSSRGLFSHVRLAHQGKTIEKSDEWRQHPYSVNKAANNKIQNSLGKRPRKPIKHTTYGEAIGSALLIAGINAFIAAINKERPQGQRIGYIPDHNP